MLCAVCRLTFVGCCFFSVAVFVGVFEVVFRVRCLSYVVGCWLSFVVLSIVCCLVFVVLFAVCFLRFVDVVCGVCCCLLCKLFAVCWRTVVGCCLLCVVCRWLYCLLFGVWC